MKKVLIEMERLRDINSGLGQFCLGLGKAIAEKAGNLSIDYYLPSKLSGVFGNDVAYVPVSKFDKILGIGSSAHGIVHCTHQESAYLPKGRKTKLILTIHDLNFLYKYKSGFKKKYKLKRLQKKINKADALVFISRFTESEVRKQLDVPDIPTRVVYNGNTLGDFSRQKADGIPSGDFIFTIGIVQPKKNFHVILSLLSPDSDLKLFIAGRQDETYTAYIKEKAAALGVSDKVIFGGMVDDASKYYLYTSCKAFVFPSLSEGFGLPVIEAMSLGKPVFLSKLTSLPEIGGPEAYYFGDFSPESMKSTFKKGMEDYHSDPEKKQRIIDWSRNFTWEKAAEEYLKLYRELLP